MARFTAKRYFNHLNRASRDGIFERWHIERWHVERWSKDVAYARNTESGCKNLARGESSKNCCFGNSGRVELNFH